MKPNILDAADLGFVPRDRPYWTSPEMVKTFEGAATLRPLFTTGEVAHVFLGRSTSWLKQALWFLPRTAGVLAEVAPPRRPSGQIGWRLYDVERLAHALLQRGAITLQHWVLTLQIVKACAVMNRFDVGDPQMTQPLDDDSPVSRQRALALVVRRMDEQDDGQPPAEPDNVAEHLISHAAYALRHLEEFLAGAQHD